MANQYLKLPSTIVDAADVGSGTVNNTEFGYLDGVTSSIQTQIDTATTDIMNIQTQINTLDGVTSSIQTQIDTATTDILKFTSSILDAKKDDQFLRILGALGSDIKALSFGAGYPSDNFINLTDNYVFFTAVWLPVAATITGVKFHIAQTGSYTADNENRIGLYTWSGGTLTLVASCANDANLWAGALGVNTKAFSSTYAAIAGLYFVGALYNNSAQVTVPMLTTNGVILYSSGTCTMGMATTSKVCMNQNPHNTLPSSVTVSATSNQQQPLWFALY